MNDFYADEQHKLQVRDFQSEFKNDEKVLPAKGTNQINEFSIIGIQKVTVSPYPKYAAVGPGKLRR